jgi:hypothetical protein
LALYLKVLGAIKRLPDTEIIAALSCDRSGLVGAERTQEHFAAFPEAVGVGIDERIFQVLRRLLDPRPEISSGLVKTREVSLGASKERRRSPADLDHGINDCARDFPVIRRGPIGAGAAPDSYESKQAGGRPRRSQKHRGRIASG